MADGEGGELTGIDISTNKEGQVTLTEHTKDSGEAFSNTYRVEGINYSGDQDGGTVKYTFRRHGGELDDRTIRQT